MEMRAFQEYGKFVCESVVACEDAIEKLHGGLIAEFQVHQVPHLVLPCRYTHLELFIQFLTSYEIILGKYDREQIYMNREHRVIK